MSLIIAGENTCATRPMSRCTRTVVPSETAELPPSKPDEVHVAVEAPFVYRATDPPPPQPAPTAEAQKLPVTLAHAQPPFRSAVLGPPPPPPVAPMPAEVKPQHRGVFGKIKGFFSAIFK